VNRPRLLLVNAHGADPATGGTEKNVARLAAGLNDFGWEVSLLSAFPAGRRSPDEVVLFRHHWRRSRWRRLRHHLGDVVSWPGFRLDRAMGDARPDLVHTQNLFGLSTAVWESARRLDVPVVHTLNDYHLLCPKSTLLRSDGHPCRPSPLLCGLRARRLGRWCGPVRHVVGVSEHILVRHAHLFTGARQHVVRNPFEPPSIATTVPRSRPEVIGYIGILHPSKGVPELLAAVAPLAERGISVHLAGDGPLRPQVEEAARRHATVHYAGVVRGNGRWRFMEQADLGIAPSIWEEPGAPPQVVLEWLSMKRPVLVSDRGGLGESLALCPGAIAIEPTGEGICAAVESLIDDPRAWTAARRSAREPITALGESDWLRAHDAIYRMTADR
jgi:glycosyltransferase involved in cell wall biosynthesis